MSKFKVMFKSPLDPSNVLSILCLRLRRLGTSLPCTNLLLTFRNEWKLVWNSWWQSFRPAERDLVFVCASGM